MAEETTGGLDSLPGAVVKAAPVKGGISVPGNNMLDPTQTEELLAQMQDLINRKSKVNPLGDTIQDMQAALVGQSQQRQNYKDQQAQDIFNMRAQMAALRGSQQMNQNMSSSFDKQLEALRGGNVAGGAGATGTAGTAGTQDISALPPSVLQYAAYLKSQGPAGLAEANKFIGAQLAEMNKARNTAEQNFQNNPASYEQHPFNIPGVGVEDMNAIQYREFVSTGKLPSGRSVPKSVVQQTTPQASGKPTTATAPGAPQTPISKLMPNQVNAIPQPGQGQGQGQLLKFENKQISAIPGQQQSAPFQTVSQPGGYKSLAQIKAEQELQNEIAKEAAKAKIETEAKRQQAINAAKSQSTAEERKKAGEFISKVEENGKRADEIALSANQVIDHATRRPYDFGITEHAGIVPAAVGAISHLPYVGGSAEKAYGKLTLPEESIQERSKTDTNAQKLGLDYAQQMFAGSGARLGAALEKMAIDAKGVGTQYTAESNIMNSAIIRAAAQKAKEQATLWSQYKNSHDNPDPYDFIQSPENQALEDKYEKQLKQDFPKYFNDKTIPPKVGEERPTKSGKMSVWDGKQWVYK